MLISVVVLILLTLISGVLSSSEIAVSSANRNKVKLRAEGGDKKAARLLAIMDEPGNFFATTQLYITFIAFFSGAYAANSFTYPLLGALENLGFQVPEAVVFITITAILTYVTLIFGELVPKRIAMQYAIPFALRAIIIMKVLTIIALPFVKGLSASARAVLKLFGIKDDGHEEDVTKEEIRLMVESGGELGHIDESEQDMIENIFELDNITAADICTHRMDVEAVAVDADFKTVADLLINENYSRIPVYEESLDYILGILHSKDVMKYMVTNPDTDSFDIKALMRDPYFVPLSKKARELFQEMRRERVYMSVVIDEYGGMMGIVTMEDFVEVIVGSIQDEYDTDEQPDIAVLNENSGENIYRIQGTADLESVQDLFDIPLPIDEYDTLSGFIVGQLGHIPGEDEKPTVAFNGLIFKVENVQDKRIATVVVEPEPVDAANNAKG